MLRKQLSCFRGSLSWTPDHLTWMKLDQPGRPGQHTVVHHLTKCICLPNLYTSSACNYGWIWKACVLFCVFLSPPRCTDRETGRQAGDEASVCARVGPEVFGHGRDLQRTAGALWGHGPTHPQPATVLRLQPQWHPGFSRMCGEDQGRAWWVTRSELPDSAGNVMAGFLVSLCVSLHFQRPSTGSPLR